MLYTLRVITYKNLLFTVLSSPLTLFEKATQMSLISLPQPLQSPAHTNQPKILHLTLPPKNNNIPRKKVEPSTR